MTGLDDLLFYAPGLVSVPIVAASGLVGYLLYKLIRNRLKR